MTNKFRIGEIVIVNSKGKEGTKEIKAIGIIEHKDYYFNEYLVTLVSSNKQEWIKEKNIEKVIERKIKKQEKYKVVLAINKKGLDIIMNKLKNTQNKNNNILKKADLYYEYKACKNKYVILIWTTTYWSKSNFVVKCIEETLKDLRRENIAYKRIIIGITDPTYIKINEFIENDDNVDIFNIFHKIEIKKIGGILA